MASACPTAAEPARPAARNVWVELLLYPTHTLPTAAAPVIVALGLAAHDRVLALVPALVAFGCSWLIHVAGVFTDNHRLLAEHPDVPEHPELTAALADGSLTLRGLAGAVVACFALAAAAVPYLFGVAGAGVLALGLIGTVSSLGYSLTRWSETRLGLAHPVFFAMFGVVATAGAYYVQAAAHGRPLGWAIAPGLIPLPALVVGLPAAAIVTNVLLIDDIRDTGFDARKGWRTPPVSLGLTFARFEFVALTALAYVLPVWFWLGLHLGPPVLLPLLSLPLAVRIARTLCTDLRFETLHRLTPQTAGLALLHATLLAIGLAAG